MHIVQGKASSTVASLHLGACVMMYVYEGKRICVTCYLQFWGWGNGNKNQDIHPRQCQGGSVSPWAGAVKSINCCHASLKEKTKKKCWKAQYSPSDDLTSQLISQLPVKKAPQNHRMANAGKDFWVHLVQPLDSFSPLLLWAGRCKMYRTTVLPHEP